MADSHFILSAFGDEVDDDLATQLDVLASEEVFHLELRSAWGVNVLDLDTNQLAQARALLREREFGVSAIGSPIGKSPIDREPAFELERLERAIVAADALDTPLIRVFSYYVPAERSDDYRDEVLSRMAALTERAATAGVTLVHENEKEIYGESARHCQEILASVDSPSLRMAFDPANFVQAGIQPMVDAWPLLADYTTHIHIKDAISSGEVKPAGEGEGGIPELLKELRTRGYRGFLTLEPHLQLAGPAGGYSGPEGMRVAIRALKKLLAA